MRRTCDAWSNPVTVTDRNGHVTTFAWDERGRLLRRGPVSYRYDTAGRVIAIGMDGTTHLHYDGERMPSEIVDPEGGVTRLDVRDGLGEVGIGEVLTAGLIGGATGVVGAGAGLFLSNSARLATVSPFLRGAVSGGVSNVLGGGVNRGLNGDTVFNPAGMATDLLLGGVTGGVGGRVGAAAVTPNRPYTIANLPPDTFGETDKLGNIFIRPGLTPDQFAETLRHETVHSILSPGSARLADLRMRLYTESHLWRYTEEALAETYATLSPRAGVSFPLGPNAYGIELKELAKEGALVAGGAGALGFGGYQLVEGIFGAD